MKAFQFFDAEQRFRIIRLLVCCVLLSGYVLIPLRIIGYGYLPPDDALRHAAMAVANKPWSEVLVFRADAPYSFDIGWQAFLTVVYHATRCTPDQMVVFSVVFLVLLFLLPPVFYFRRQESWGIAVAIAAVSAHPAMLRIFLGRPYIISMILVVYLSSMWVRFKESRFPWMTGLGLAVLTMIATWAHLSWYFYLGIALCFFLSGSWRAGTRILLCTLAGIICGGFLIGNPLVFFPQSLHHLFSMVTKHQLTRMLVYEMQPSGGEQITVCAVAIILLWRKVLREDTYTPFTDPVFLLAAGGWLLGLSNWRFWLDWGFPAYLVWIARQLNDLLEQRVSVLSWRRVVVALFAVGTALLLLSSDIEGRWTQDLTREDLSLQNAEQAPWLPDEGGVFYSDSMRLYYRTFFRNPTAQWRYILGHEATLMPPEDLDVYRSIQFNQGVYEAFKPWVRKMRPQDRLVLERDTVVAPNIPELEWYYAARGIWIGRVPRVTAQEPYTKNADEVRTE